MSRRLILATFALTALWELIAVALRFGGGFESTRDTAPFLSALTFGLRIHHGYIGLLLVLVGYAGRSWLRRWSTPLLVLGWSLIASDLIHHFLVLWPITGSPEFDLLYPAVSVTRQPSRSA